MPAAQAEHEETDMNGTMMAEDTTHNGWTNRATWLVNLHLTNDQGLYEMAREATSEAFARGRSIRSVAPLGQGFREGEREAIGRSYAADAVKELVEQVTDWGTVAPSTPVNEPASLLVRDLIGQALVDVDWREIAEGLLED